MVARGPGPHRGLGKPEREDPARVEEPAPGVRIHIVLKFLTPRFGIEIAHFSRDPKSARDPT